MTKHVSLFLNQEKANKAEYSATSRARTARSKIIPNLGLLTRSRRVFPSALFYFFFALDSGLRT